MSGKLVMANLTNELEEKGIAGRAYVLRSGMTGSKR